MTIILLIVMTVVGAACIGGAKAMQTGSGKRLYNVIFACEAVGAMLLLIGAIGLLCIAQTSTL